MKENTIDKSDSDQRPITGHGAFQTTHWSLILRAKNDANPAEASQALEHLCKRYWQPLYNYLRRQGLPSHDAQDTTQSFFAALLEKDKLQHVQQERGRFRSFLLKSLKNFYSNQRERQNAQKRGGTNPTFSLDELTAEKQFEVEANLDLSADEAFDRKWAQSVIEHSMSRLKAEFQQAGTLDRFTKLNRFLLTDPEPGKDYETLACQLQLSQSGLRSAIHRLRRRFFLLFQEEIADTVDSPEAIEDEVTYLWRILSK